MRRVAAGEVDPNAHVYVNRPGRTAYRFTVHSVRQRIADRQVRIEYGGTHVVAEAGRRVLVDDIDPAQSGDLVPPDEHPL